MLKSLLAAVTLLMPTAVHAQDWWVVIGYFDHPPMEWDDGIMNKATALESALTDCGLTAFWDFAAKFQGFDTDGRGTVFVINTFIPLNRTAAENLLAATTPCVADAYIKQASYAGE